MTPCTSSSLATDGASGHARSSSPPARAIAVRTFRTSRSSRAAASRTGLHPSRPGCAAMKKWRWSVEETRPGRRQYFSPATRVTCACWCAGSVCRARCRAISSNGSRVLQTSRCLLRPRSLSFSARPTSVCRASVGATDEPGQRNTTRSRTCSSSPAPIRRQPGSTAAASPSTKKGSSGPVRTRVQAIDHRSHWRQGCYSCFFVASSASFCRAPLSMFPIA